MDARIIVDTTPHESENVVGLGRRFRRRRRNTSAGRIADRFRFLRLPIQAKGNEEQTLELKLFEMSTIKAATNDFSMENLLGEGGFGPVYKGQMARSKRLSKGSVQGLEEFRNEALLIVQLQHKNLIRLLGCCIEEGERILVYEYMPNNSLDTFIFDSDLS